MKNIDWANLPFSYIKTDCNIRCLFSGGKWGQVEVHTSDRLDISIAASSLHYGQECFEGLKAYRGRDTRIRLFRWEENWERLQKSASYILMPDIPKELFRDMLHKAVKLNDSFVPPYGTGATLYIRPFVIGMGQQVGLNPATEYLFTIFVSPVGPYFKGGFSGVDLLIDRSYDRAAPRGTGNIKVGGNYAASLKATKGAKDKGYSAVLYLDPKEKQYIDECGPANFFGIKGNAYITPDSASILPSITNKSLQELAASIGMDVEKRTVHISELDNFDEVGACGTAAVLSPVARIDDPEMDKSYIYSHDRTPGPICTKLYQTLTGIQCGDIPDTFGWVSFVD
jgi:branched-chain amino acid aminotransferase